MGQAEDRDQKTALRQEAEALIRENPMFASYRGHHNLPRLLQEIQVYHAELEIQNEELRKTQTQLTESRDRYYELYDFAPIGYCTLHTNGLIDSVNLACSELLGAARRDLINRSLSSSIIKEDRSAFTLMLRDCLSKEGKQSCEVTLQRKDKSPGAHVLLEVTLRRDAAGVLFGFHLAIIDITELKRQERELALMGQSLELRVQERTEELARKNEQLKSLAHELLMMDQRARYQLATELHDYLAQLIVVAKMKSERLKQKLIRDMDREGLEEVVKVLDESQHYMRGLISQLSPLSLISGGLMPALRDLAATMRHNGLVVFVHGDEPVDLPQHVASLIYQSVRELLHNALKYAQTESATVVIRQSSHHLLVTVEDKGAGFDPNAPRGVTNEGHFGLYSLMQRMEALGGEMHIQSARDEGTKVSLSLPLVRASGSESAFLGGKENIQILIADDHEAVRRGLRVLIDEQPGFHVCGEASDGVSAVELTRRLKPDAIIMDINMPAKSGIEATREIKDTFSDVTVVGLTVREDTESHKQFFSAGATAIFPKGSSIADICSTIRTACKT